MSLGSLSQKRIDIKTAELKQQSTVMLSDATRTVHELTLEDARNIALAVSEAYGILYFAHDAAQAAAEAATTVEEVINIAF